MLWHDLLMRRLMKNLLFSSLCSRARNSAVDLVQDCRGLAATESALIVPVMLVLFFGTVEFSSGIAVDRKVSQMARTLSDLTSRSNGNVQDTDLKNIVATGALILTPYSVTPVKATISEIFVDSNKIAKIQWSKAATVAMVGGAPQATFQTSVHNPKDTVSPPPDLLVPNTWLIWGEVDYSYTPAVGYVLKNSLPLHDQAYTRPRQSLCIDSPPPTGTPVS
jgi:Flp pilus assembly protein TadG